MASHTCSTNARGRRGFTIAEALTASVILALAVAGVAGPMGASAEQAKVSRENGTALVLARQLLEEIAAKPLCDSGNSCHLGPEYAIGETTRAKYDSADDYNNYADTTRELRMLDGTRMDLSTDGVYTRSVKVEYRASAAGNAATSGDFALVTVSITTPHKKTIAISKLMTRNSLSF